MTNKEKTQIEDILEFLLENKCITDYKVDGNTICVKTEDTDEEDIEFLKFKISMATAVVNEKFEDTITVEVSTV